MSRFYVTTAIPYVNAAPHIGFALEAVVADAIARHRRQRGDDVRFQTGTDDNSLSAARTAEAEDLPVTALVCRNATRFEALGGALDLSFDDFIRTSNDPRHLAGAARLWRACEASGDVYRARYRGRYCVGCERFLDDDELVDGCCPAHRTRPEEVDEENWFFRLTRYEEQLRGLVSSGTLRIVPEASRNEVLSLLRSGLRDFSISRSVERSRGWGVPVPGDPSQVMYVWFDALGNYITALGYADDGQDLTRYWRENPHRLHIIGKDIVRFHAVYWPAILLSAGLEVPSAILCHGFVTVEGAKIGKSLGNAVDPFALVGELGTDTVRYFLLRHIRTTADGDFSRTRLVEAHNAELADQLGNLLSRVASMVDRYLGGRTPDTGPAEGPLAAIAQALPGEIDAAMERFAVHEAVSAIWRLIEEANRYVVREAPWVLAHQDDTRLSSVLGELCHGLRAAGEALRPFLPATSSAVLERIGPPGGTVRSGPHLFAKLDG